VPSGSGTNVGLRLLTVAGIALAVVVVGVVLLRGDGGDYRVSMTLDNANQLVKGNQVKVGGVTVGSVSRIALADDGRARVELSIDDSGPRPLRRGTHATVRSTSLSGIANRYVALQPGPAGGPAIADGGPIPAEGVHGEVDLDQVLNTLDPSTQADLRTVVGRLGSGFDGPAGSDLNAGLRALNPALSQAGLTEAEILRDQERFERFITESADVVTAVASRDDRLPRLVANTHATLDAVARRSASLESSLARLPPALRQANTTLVDLRAAIGDLRPTVRLAQPAAPLLSDFLRELHPTARLARPVVADLRRTIDRSGDRDLIGVLRRLEPVSRTGVPALRSTVPVVDDLLPILDELRPYTPDLVGGLLNGFGGSTGGYYDANGHFVRISFHSSAYSGQGALSFLPAPDSTDGLAGFRRGVTRRCPGAAVQPHPDGSNPYVEQDRSCSRGDTAR
jgi:phospholipid/cholesterol/gamma-HCH transport system substrate-binding protein